MFKSFGHSISCPGLRDDRSNERIARRPEPREAQKFDLGDAGISFVGARGSTVFFLNLQNVCYPRFGRESDRIHESLPAHLVKTAVF